MLNTSDRAEVRHKLFIILAALVLVGILLWLSAELARQSATNKLSIIANEELGVYVANLSSELDKHESLPRIFAEYPLFKTALKYPANKTLVERVNEKLVEFNLLGSALDTYIIDRTGLTYAASNWNDERSFVGEDLSFRPYFVEALQGKLSHYFALGSTSGQRGYYYAAPIQENQSILGVLVVKVDLVKLEDAWIEGAQLITVTDQDGVMFITTRKDWLYRSLTPLSAESSQRIQSSRRYWDNVPSAIDAHYQTDHHGNTILRVSGSSAHTEQRYLQQSFAMPDREWVVHILSDLSDVEQHVRSIVFINTLISLALFLAWVIAYLRWAAKQQKLKIEHQMKVALEASNKNMEKMIQRRTEALSYANEKLTAEVVEHKQTAEKLMDTQDQLVQATKMGAMGQMATSITHELNQPLAAIRSFADNGQVYLERNMPSEASANLDLIATMAKRMKDIMQHLKSFARKTPLKLEPVSLNSVLHETLLVLHTPIRRSGTVINYTASQPDIFVVGEPVRLQQVFTNLVQNALDAISDCPGREITINIDAAKKSVSISVQDSGRGVPVESQMKVFEPFYSTKETGSGLGLGLSITYGIIQAFGGKLEVKNALGGGAVFTVSLRLAHVKQEAPA